jgi:hypothetical protein
MLICLNRHSPPATNRELARKVPRNTTGQIAVLFETVGKQILLLFQIGRAKARGARRKPWHLRRAWPQKPGPTPLKLENSLPQPIYHDVGATFGGCPFPEPGGRPGFFPVSVPVCTPPFVDTTRYPIFPSTAFRSSINFFSRAAIACFSASRLSTDFTNSSSFSATESSFLGSFATFSHTAAPPKKKRPASTKIGIFAATFLGGRSVDGKPGFHGIFSWHIMVTDHNGRQVGPTIPEVRDFYLYGFRH